MEFEKCDINKSSPTRAPDKGVNSRAPDKGVRALDKGVFKLIFKQSLSNT